MTAKTSLWRLASLLVAFAVTVGAWTPADAKIHTLGGNARLQIGDGLPIPIGFTPAPDGKVVPVSGAVIQLHGEHSVTNPARVVLDPTQLQHPGGAQNLPVFANNPNVFQVKTDIPLNFPHSKIMWSAGGRTGASTVQFCPGDVVTADGNPACASGSAGTIAGRLTYTKTSHQFGGPAFFEVLGVADVALKAGSPAPCAIGTNPNCFIIFAIANPNALAAGGAPFGFFNTTTGAAPSPGLFRGTVRAAGVVLNLTSPGLGSGLPNPATSYGGPWTTGMLTVEQPAALPAPETFILTGSDGRMHTVSSTPVPSSQTPNGTGALSLVAGAVSDRGVSGPNANRGWLNLQVGSRLSHVPMMPAYGVAAVVGLTALSGAYVLRRRNRK